MLWGCSSGKLKYMGEFDRTGTPYHYMLAGWYVPLFLVSSPLPLLTTTRT